MFLWNNLGSKKVKLLRIPKRAGLMRARVFGAKHASGEVSLFLIFNTSSWSLKNNVVNSCLWLISGCDIIMFVACLAECKIISHVYFLNLIYTD